MYIEMLHRLTDAAVERRNATQVDDGTVEKICDDERKILSVGYCLGTMASGLRKYDSELVAMVRSRARQAIQELNGLCRECGLQSPFPEGHIGDDELYTSSFSLWEEECEYVRNQRVRDRCIGQ